jgi:hypothetical protein
MIIVDFVADLFTANTATGSTADISDENRNVSSNGNSNPKIPVMPQKYKPPPMCNRINK